VLRIFEALLFSEWIGCGRHVNERQSIRQKLGGVASLTTHTFFSILSRAVSSA
jgi:hypothetical protein